MTRLPNPTAPARFIAGNREITLRRLEQADRSAIEAFVRTLREEDLLYNRRDLTNAKVITAWFEAELSGELESMVAEHDGAIMASASVVRDPHSWSPHVAELRVMVGPDAQRSGIGRRLIEGCFMRAVEMGVDKLTAHMTVEQVGAVAIFEEMGFRGEALLKDHVKDSQGELHDIAILSCKVEDANRRLALYGIEPAA